MRTTTAELERLRKAREGRIYFVDVDNVNVDDLVQAIERTGQRAGIVRVVGNPLDRVMVSDRRRRWWQFWR